MSEKGPRGFNYEASHNPEKGHFETAPEKRPEWDPYNPKCEAKATRRTVQQGRMSGMYTLEGRRVDLPRGVTEQPEIIETSINCDSCPLVEQFRSEGMGFAAFNASSRRVRKILQNCPKLVARGYKPGKIPDNLLPS